MSQNLLYRDVEIIIPINNWFDRRYMFPMSGTSDEQIVEQAQKVGEDTVRKFNLNWDKKKPIRAVIYDQDENVISYWVNKVEKKIKDVFDDKNDETGTIPQKKQTAEEKLAAKTKTQTDSRTPL